MAASKIHGNHCCHVARAGAASLSWLGGATGPGWVTGWVTIMGRESSTDDPSNLVAVYNRSAKLPRSLAYFTRVPSGLRIFLHKSGKNFPTFRLAPADDTMASTDAFARLTSLCPCKPRVRATFWGRIANS